MSNANYTVTARSNYNTVSFASKAKAISYARSITDSTNNQSTVVDAAGNAIARYCYTPNNGGKTYKAVA